MRARLASPLAAAVLGAFVAPAMAQTAPAATTTTATTAAVPAPANPTAGSGTAPTSAPATTTAAVPTDRRTPPASRLANEFGSLAGSSDNATALINGLRNGSAITLAAPASGGGTGSAETAGTTFTAPNGPMSYGNIRIALSLARAQLASEGVTNPTPQQLQAALVGSGTAGSSPGILDRRAAGMGWGRIAHDMGMKLGPVVSHSGRMAVQAPVRHDYRGESHRSGIVTAGGGDGSRHQGARQHAERVEHQHRHTEQRRVAAATPATPRIVTAAGAPATNIQSPAYKATGRSVVTAAGSGGDHAPKKGVGQGKS